MVLSLLTLVSANVHIHVVELLLAHLFQQMLAFYYRKSDLPACSFRKKGMSLHVVPTARKFPFVTKYSGCYACMCMSAQLSFGEGIPRASLSSYAQIKPGDKN